jgi:flagellar motility protein MotE (MotC chaperone)
MIRILQSSWFNTLAGCLVYLGVTAALMHPGHLEGVREQLAAPAERSASDDPSWKFRNPELDLWIAEIQREREALGARSQQLRELQIRLEAERLELSNITQHVARLQADFDRNVLRIADQEAENLKRQARVFSAMSPEAVANLVRQMPEDDAAKILFLMKSDEVSAVLEALNGLGPAGAQRAADISKKTSRILPPNTAPASGTAPR